MAETSSLLNAAISACDKGGRWDQALVLLYRMEVSGITPDAVSYSAAIAACGHGGADDDRGPTQACGTRPCRVSAEPEATLRWTLKR